MKTILTVVMILFLSSSLLTAGTFARVKSVEKENGNLRIIVQLYDETKADPYLGESQCYIADNDAAVKNLKAFIVSEIQRLKQPAEGAKSIEEVTALIKKGDIVTEETKGGRQ